MEIITIDNNNYILGDDIIKYAPIYSKSCRSSRQLVRTKKIDVSKYTYVRKVNDKWIKCDGKSVKFDKIIINEEIIKTIPELNNLNQLICDDNGVEKAPNIINLNDNEKFRDNENNILEIETRGEREPNKIFFKVKDVSDKFNKEHLQNEIINQQTLYKHNIDYKYFICDKKNSIVINTTKNTSKKISSNITTIKKELYLTYEGILRVLFVSRNNTTTNFIKWVVEKLFTIQMGSIEDKNKLVSHIKGVSYETIQELFSINARSLPCVYLTAFNTVKELKKVMNIDNKHSEDAVVYKFGLTKSFESRKNGHRSEYKKLDNFIDMKLVYYTYIDPIYISQAELEIKNLLSEYKLEWDNHDELVIIPNNLLKIIKTIYENIGMKYSGHTQEFNRKIEELNKIIMEYEHKNNILIKDLSNERIIFNKDKELFESKINNKNFEIENLKKELRIKELELLLSKS
jgi:hypothetical protein